MEYGWHVTEHENRKIHTTPKNKLDMKGGIAVGKQDFCCREREK